MGIEGGTFNIARKIFQSEIWLRKPSSWNKIWLYILGKVSYKTSGTLKRGVGYFNFTKEQELMGVDITKDMIKKCLAFLRESEMIRTTKSTRGMYIEVLNYNVYQTLDNYGAPVKAPQKHHRSTTEAPLYNKKLRSKEVKYSTEGAEVLKLFESLDSKNKTYYGNTTQRAASDFLLKEYGMDKVEKAVEIIRVRRGTVGFPSITSPYELKEKWTKIAEALMRDQHKEIIKAPKVAFT